MAVNVLKYQWYVPSNLLKPHKVRSSNLGTWKGYYSRVYYNEQFLSIKSGCYSEYRCYNERGGILSADVAGACA